MIKLFGAALIALALPGTAFAATATLEYKDLDLMTEAGQAQLAARIEAVARNVCESESMTGTRIPNTSDRDSCMAEAKAQMARRFVRRSDASPILAVRTD